MRPSTRAPWSVATALLAVVALAGCSPASSESDAAAESGGLPGPHELVPAEVAGAHNWIPVTAHSETFDVDITYESPRAVAHAYGASLLESSAPGPGRPSLALEAAVETDARAILIIAESGIGDDSVAGTSTPSW